MFTIGLRDARSHFSRFLMSIIAIALGVAFVVGSFSFRNMLEDQMNAAFATSSEGDVYIRGARKQSGVSASPLLDHNSIKTGLIKDVAKVSGVKSAVRMITLNNSALVDKSGNAVSLGGTGTVTTVSMAENASWRSTIFLKGDYPHGYGEIALLDETAKTARLSVGDKTTFVYPSGPRKVKVSGVFSLKQVAQGTYYVGIDPAVAERENAYMIMGTAKAAGAKPSSASASASSGSASIPSRSTPSSPANQSASGNGSPSGQAGGQTSGQGMAASRLPATAMSPQAAQALKARQEAELKARQEAIRKAQKAAEEKMIAQANEVTTSITVYGKANHGRPLTHDQQVALAKRINKELEANPLSRGKYEARAITGDTLRQEQKDNTNTMMGFLQPMILIFAFIALFVGAFVIANTFSMIVRESMRGYALLRSVGASPSQVFMTVIVQALLMGLIGSIIGVFLGWGLMAVIAWGLSKTGSAMGGSTMPGLNAVLLGIVVGILVSLIGAALPARRAAYAPPIQAMNETVNPQKPTRLRGWIGLTMLTAGLFFWWLTVALVDHKDKNGAGPTVIPALNTMSSNAALAVGSVLVIIAVIVITPSLVVPAQRVLGFLPALLFPVSGKLAARNLDRSKRRTANTAAALFVGLAIVAAIGTLTASLTASTAGRVDNDLKATFLIRSQTTGLPNGVEKDIESVKGVKSVLPLEMIPRLKYNGKQLTAVTVAVKPGFFTDVFESHMTSGVSAPAARKGEIIVGKTIADDNKWKVGQTVTICSPDASLKAKIGGITDSAMQSQVVFLPQSLKGKLLKSYSGYTYVLYATVKAEASPEERKAVQNRLRKAVKKYYVVSVLDKDGIKSTAALMINSIMIIVDALLALSIIIAIFGVVNTMALSILERTREIGLLRAIGTSRGQVRGMIAIEAIMISILGTVLGLAVGVAAGCVIQKTYSSSGLATLSIPWGQIGFFLVLSIFVGLIASLSPARKALQAPVLDAVSDE